MDLSTGSKNVNRPCVSVIIVNWNRKDDLKECLQSVLDQTFKDVELIVVDNHSTDGSVDLIREEYPLVNLVILPDSSSGACEAFNIGFAKAVGEYCVVMDNDALLEADWIERALKEFEGCTELACVAGRVLNYYTGDDWGFEHYGRDDTWRDKEFFTTTFVGCSAAIRRDVLNKVGGYPAEYFIYWNEHVLGARIVNAGYKIKYSPRLIAYHKVSLAQRSPLNRLYYYGIRNGYWYFWTYYPLNIVLKHTLIHFIVTSPLTLKAPSAGLKASFDAIRRLPVIKRTRDPISDTKSFRPIPL